MKDISLSLILASVFIFHSVSGSTSANANLISIALLVVWVIIATLSSPKSFYYAVTRPQVKALMVFIVFLFTTSMYVGGFFNSIKLVGQSIFIFSPMVIYSYYANSNIRKLKLLLKVCLVLFFYFIIKSLIFYTEFENAARQIAADKSALGDLAIGGGYSLAYASVIFTIFLTDLMINKNISNLKIKVLVILSMLLMSYFVFKTKSTLTIIWLIVGVLLVLFSKKRRQINDKNNLLQINKGRTDLSRIILIILSICVTFFIYESIGKFLIENANENNVVSQRLSELGKSAAYGIDNSDYSEYRIGRYVFSFISFFKSPIIGNGFEYGYIYKNSLPYIGGHSEWIDSLANFGLVGSIPFFLIFYFVIKSGRLISRHLASNSYILVVFLLGLFNPLLEFQITFILMLIIPLLSKIIIISKIQHSNMTRDLFLKNCSTNENNCNTLSISK